MFEEELRKFNEHQAQRNKAKAEGDADAVVRLAQGEDYSYDQLH